MTSARALDGNVAGVGRVPQSAGLRVALSRLDDLLRERVATLPERPDTFRGLVITPEEALYLALAPGLENSRLHGSVGSRSSNQSCGKSHGATDPPGAEDALSRIADVFGLSPLDVDLLILAVAPDLDLRYQKLFGFLQDDVTKTRPTVGFALDLLMGSDLARLEHLHHVAEDSPAIVEGLVQVLPDARDAVTPLAGRALAADGQVLRWLTGAPALDPRVRALRPEEVETKHPVTEEDVDTRTVLHAARAAARREERFRGIDLELPARATLRARRHDRQVDDALGHQVDTSVRWADLVLPTPQTQALRELCNRVRHRSQVFDEWGFGRRVLGRGALGLFAGPPGTGKTMAARVIASDLGQPLHRVDIGQVVSKYVGETEKNLARVFAAACGTDAVLLFDEADALFGKRTDVRDSHDRYANQEVAYLLAQVEEYDGLALLTTNLSDNIDPAFLRRVTAVVSFPMPNAEARRLMWQQVWPSRDLLDNDVDLDSLAGHRLSGAGIRDAALTAAFLAATDDSLIRASHLRAAIRRELVKAGRIHGAALTDTGSTDTGREGHR